jgi:putative transposase
MEILKAYRFRLEPDEVQERFCRQTAGSCRFLKNLCLEQRSMAWSFGRHSVGFAAQCSDTADLKEMLPWLSEAPSQVLQQAIKDLDWAFKRFFAGIADYPTFQKKGEHDSFRFPQGFEVDEANRRVKFPKMGWVRYRQGRGKSARKIQGEVRSITVSRDGDHWFASILCKQEAATPPAVHGFAVGADLGVAKAIALSTGEVLEVLGMTKAEQKKLAKLQQAMAKKMRFSKNWQKLKRRIARLHSTVARRRRDSINKATTYLAKNHRLIVIEDLRVKNMTRAPKPKADPDLEGAFLPNGAAAKAGLNRVVLDKGFGEIRRQLDYKHVWYGSQLLAENPAYTSQKCSECGHTEADNRQSQEGFCCLKCGHTENADLNAAKNILSAGIHTERTVGHTGVKRKANPLRQPAKHRKPAA